MDVVIQKVGERDGKERFVLAKASSGEVITAKDASEGTIRKYFRAKGLSNGFLDECLQKSRARYDKKLKAAAKPSPASSSKPAAPQPVAAASAPIQSVPAQPAPAQSAAAKPAAAKPAAKPKPAAEDDDDFLFELGLDE